jgi:hypothetical protein
MTVKEIIAHRLVNQQIAGSSIKSPEEMVSHMVAMQAQDWNMAKWAIGLRVPGLKEADIDKAFNDGKILRTHMMRPTWHIVTPADIRWMLQLTSPRVQAFNANYYRKQELDKNIFRKCNAILGKSLMDHQYKTRTDLRQVFSKAKIATDDLRMTLIMMNAELEGLVCSGPKKGKQFTYSLLEERVAASKPLNKAEALHQLTARYFKTRGPATVKDFSWWSGLTLKETREGVDSLDSHFLHEVVNESEYIFYNQPVKDLGKLQTTFLIPDYDEYGISYKDRTIYDKGNGGETLKSADFYHAIAVDGYFGGTWKKTLKGNRHVIEIKPFQSLSKKQLIAVDKATQKCINFFS